jgi:hypothetical protein
MEELLIEMKSDVVRLPSELGKIPSVSSQLKMDEISIISKLAKTPVSQSVITQAPPIGRTAARSKSPRPIKKEVVVGADKSVKSIVPGKVAYSVSTGASSQPGSQVQQLTSAPVAVQTAEGLMVYSVASNTPPPQSLSVVQATPGAATTTSAKQTIAIGVPTYLDGSNLYQLVPAASGQQVVYWPPVVGGTGQTSPAQVTSVAASGSGTGVVAAGTVGGAPVAVGGAPVAVGGAPVAVGGAQVAVGGTQVAVVQGSPATVLPVAAATAVLQRGTIAPVAGATAVLQPVQQGEVAAPKKAQKSVITID